MMVTNIWVNIGSGNGFLPYFSTVRFCGIHLRAISQWALKQLFCITSLKIIQLKLYPGANELTKHIHCFTRCVLINTVSMTTG